MKNNNPVYECHITIKAADYDAALVAAKKHGILWHTSKITDDPILGPGKYAYFNRCASAPLVLMQDMEYVSACLASDGIRPLRQKIELIILDEIDPHKPSFEKVKD